MEQSQPNSKLQSALLVDLRSSRFSQESIVTTHYLDKNLRTQRDTALKLNVTEEWISQVLRMVKPILASKVTRTTLVLDEIFSLLDSQMGGTCMSLQCADALLIEHGYIDDSISITNIFRLYEAIPFNPPASLVLVNRNLKLKEKAPTIVVCRSAYKKLAFQWKTLSKMARHNGIGRVTLTESSFKPLIQFIKANNSIVSWTSNGSLLFTTPDSRLAIAIEVSFSIAECIPINDLSLNMHRALFAQSPNKNASSGYPSIYEIERFIRNSPNSKIDDSNMVSWKGRRAVLSHEQAFIVQFVSTNSWKCNELIRDLHIALEEQGLKHSVSWLKKEIERGSLILVDTSEGKRRYRYSLITKNGTRR